MRHKWTGKLKNGAVACIHCHCIKEMVKGQPTYFINDSVYLKAPKCQRNKWN